MRTRQEGPGATNICNTEQVASVSPAGTGLGPPIAREDWQAMKPACKLLNGGRFSEAEYEPPLPSDYVREGFEKPCLGVSVIYGGGVM